MDTNHERLHAEHERLQADIKELETWWKECCECGIQRFGEMGDRVGTLRRELAEHFAWEEEGGYLGDVLEDAPHLVKRAESLRKQHDAFLANFDEFAEQLRNDEPVFENWSAAHDVLENLLGQLSKHEHAETALVLEAVQRDVGSKD